MSGTGIIVKKTQPQAFISKDLSDIGSDAIDVRKPKIADENTNDAESENFNNSKKVLFIVPSPELFYQSTKLKKAREIPLVFTKDETSFHLLGIVAEKDGQILYGGRGSLHSEKNEGKTNVFFINGELKATAEEFEDFTVLMVMYGEL